MSKPLWWKSVKLVACLAAPFLHAWFVKLAWNFVLVDLFHLPAATYWQAFVLLVLVRFIK